MSQNVNSKKKLSSYLDRLIESRGLSGSQKKRASSPSSSQFTFEPLEARQLLAGVTFSDSFATDTVGTLPEIQAADVGLSWNDLGLASPLVGTGSASSGFSAPLGSDIASPSQWLGFTVPNQTINGAFTELVSTNGSTIEFDFNPTAISASLLSSNGIFVKGEVGNLIQLQLSNNDQAVPFETSVPFEVIVNGLATGASGPAANAWSHIEITLNETGWDLSWQLYDVSAGETTSLIGPVTTLTDLSYMTAGGGGATGITFSSDGGQDNEVLGGVADGDGVMFVSNVEVVDANDLPEALNDFVTLDINTDVTFNVLDNDVDEDAISLVSFEQPANGTLVDNGLGSFSYTPDPDFFGADQFDYTMDDGSGVMSTATVYVYTGEVLGLPAYASNPNAPAVLYLDFDGDDGDLPFNREGDITTFSAFEQDLMRQSVEYIAMIFSMYDVNVTTVLTPDLPKAWIRLRSNGSGGAAYVGSFPNNTVSRGWVSSSDRNLTTGLAHEYGHILNNTHQRLYDENGTETAEYRGATDGEGSVMGVDFAGNVVKWWWEHHSNTGLQNDLAKMATEISGASASATGYAADDHESSFALATPASLEAGIWSSSGVINSLGDVDTFVFDWAGGDVDVKAFRVDPFTNTNRGDPSSVDIVLSVFDLEGNLLGYSNPDSFLNNSGLDADVTIPGLEPGTYAVAISSVGDYADIGAYQLTAQAGSWSGSDPTNINGLDAPMELEVTWTAGTTVELMWDAVAGATGYSVERSSNNVDFAVVGTSASGVTEFVDEGDTEFSTAYFYRVRAVDGDGVSIASGFVEATTRSPAVTNLRVSNFIGTNKVLDWKAQRTTGETGFRIERSTDGVTYTSIATVGANTPSYTNSGLDINETYFYRVVTIDAFGDSAIATPDNAVAKFSFDDMSAKDLSSYGIDNSGTLQNGASVVYDSTRASRVLALDGVNDFVAIADSSDINLGTQANRTISISFNTSTTTGRQLVYEEGGTGSGYNIYLDEGLVYVGAYGMNDSVANAFLVTAAPILADVWYTVSLVNDTDAGQVTGYLDGVAFASAASSTMPQHTGDIAIGRVRDGTKYHDGDVASTIHPFNGMLDDFRVYNVVDVANGAPSVGNDSVLVADDQPVRISVLANDSDPDGNSLAIIGTTAGSSGAVTVNENGTVTYTPNLGFFGNDSFTYTVTDHQGGTDTATVNVEVYAAGNVARYTFDDGTAADTSPKGRNNAGTLTNGASVVADPIYGNVLSLDGVDDFVQVSDSSDINVGEKGSRTISLSFLADSITDRQVLYEEGGTTRGYNIYLDAGMLYMGAWGMTGAANVYLSAVVNAGQWNHVSWVNDLSTGLLTGYLNNTVFGQAVGGKSVSHTGDIGIGRHSDPTKFHDANAAGNGAYFAGMIDNLRVYNSVNRDPLAVADTETVDEDNSVTIFADLNDGDRDEDTLTITSAFGAASGSVVNNFDGTLTYTPNLNFHGSDVFYYRIDDGNGGNSIGQVDINVNSIADGSVTDRHVFFDGSSFDGSFDVDAIAADKTPLLPGETATYANISNYWNGINGLIVDVSGLLGVPSIADFEFRVGNDDSPGDWDVLATSPTVEFVTDPGGDYVKLTWPDNAIENQWLQVTLLSNSVTDLANDDVFYFGNAIGETGNDPANAIVNLADVSLTRQNQSGFGTVGLESVYDFNRDTRVNLIDVAIARENQSGFTPLNLITVPDNNSGDGNRLGGGGGGNGKDGGQGFVGSADSSSDGMSDGLGFESRSSDGKNLLASLDNPLNSGRFASVVPGDRSESVGITAPLTVVALPPRFIPGEEQGDFVLEVQMDMPLEALDSSSQLIQISGLRLPLALQSRDVRGLVDREFANFEQDWRRKSGALELRLEGSLGDYGLSDSEFAELFV